MLVKKLNMFSFKRKRLYISDEELKIRSDSTASAIFSAYPAAASKENNKVKSKK